MASIASIGGLQADVTAGEALLIADACIGCKCRIARQPAATQLDQMNVGRLHRFTSGKAVVALLIAALALMRSLIPSGYMLDRAEGDGRIVVQMCGGSVPHSVVLDLKTGAVAERPAQPDRNAPPGSPRGGVGDTSCPFALSAVAGLPAASAPAVPVIHVDVQPDHPSPAVSSIAWLSRPPLPGRGPPSAV